MSAGGSPPATQAPGKEARERRNSANETSNAPLSSKLKSVPRLTNLKSSKLQSSPPHPAMANLGHVSTPEDSSREGSTCRSRAESFSTDAPEFVSSRFDSVSDEVPSEESRTQEEGAGPAAAGVSLFQDPLLQYATRSNPGVIDTSSGVLSDLSATLDYFPALRSSLPGGDATDARTSTSSDVFYDSTGAGGETGETVAASKAVKNSDDVAVSVSVSATGCDGGGAANKKGSSNSSPPGFEDKKDSQNESVNEWESYRVSALSAEQHFDEDHYKYRLSSSSAAPENWPDLQNRQSKNANQAPSCQGQNASNPMNSQGSAGFDVEQETPDIRNKKSSQQNGGGRVAKQTREKRKNKNGSRKSSADVQNPVSETGHAKMDVNAKSFKPRAGSLQQNTNANQGSYPAGLNPNAASYPFLTNGGSPPKMHEASVSDIGQNTAMTSSSVGRHQKMPYSMLHKQGSAQLQKPVDATSVSLTTEYCSNIGLFSFTKLKITVICNVRVLMRDENEGRKKQACTCSCVALPCCLFDLACFFLPPSSLISMYMCMV